ncbi:MAG: DNA polymerase III subunit delta' [Chloroflexota bacterium]|nr:DNA polymerase III subunit delta' [Chloroflexota bacterium]
MWSLIGHSWAVDFLRQSLANGQLAHAYLLLGPPQIGKRTLALELAKALNCLAEEEERPCGRCPACRKIAHSTHPDVRVLEPEDGSLKIDQIRQLQRELALTPHEGRYRVAILTDFDQATTEASNCLLKTLEEPPPQVVLCLTAPDTSALLPTIVSRCQLLRLRPLSLETVESALVEHWGVDQKRAALLAHLSGGRLGWAVEAHQQPSILERRTEWLDSLVKLLNEMRVPRFAYAEEASQSPELVADILEIWLSWWRDLLLAHEDNYAEVTNLNRSEEITEYAAQYSLDQIRGALEAVRASQKWLESNANLRLTLEVLLLSFPHPQRGTGGGQP